MSPEGLVLRGRDAAKGNPILGPVEETVAAIAMGYNSFAIVEELT